MAQRDAGGGSTPAQQTRRHQREREILRSTKALFDERGTGDAQIDDIAKAVGINRAIIYRHFTGKEELFALTLVLYLADLREALAATVDDAPPTSRLTRLTEAFVDYGVAHPAFVDCAQTLMRRRGPELLHEVSQSALFRLGREIARCLAPVTEVVRAGVEAGEFEVDDVDLVANTMYASGLGMLQLARVGMLVTESAPGLPTVAEIGADQVKERMVLSALSLAGAKLPAPSEHLG